MIIAELQDPKQPQAKLARRLSGYSGTIGVWVDVVAEGCLCRD